MPEYLRPEIDEADTDQASIQAEMEARFIELVPDYEFNNLDGLRYVFEVDAGEHAETRLAAVGEGQTFDRLARLFGRGVYQVEPRDPSSATAASTWVISHTDGYLIEAGTEVTIPGLDGQPVGFQVVTDVEVPATQSSTATGEVALIAIEPGANGNGLLAGAEPEETIPDITSITLAAPTAGGSDGETDTEYLGRFTRLRTIEKPSLVLPADFELWAVLWEDDVHGSPVDRAVAKDQYNPADGTSNNVGMMLVTPITAAGGALTSLARAALKANYEANLQTGSIVHVADPLFTTVTITFSFTAYPGFDAPTVKAAAEAAVLAWLHPSQWGAGPGTGEAPVWYDEPKVRRDDVFGVLDRVPGLRHVTALSINGSTTLDLTLTVTNANPVGLPNGATSTAVGTAV